MTESMIVISEIKEILQKVESSGNAFHFDEKKQALTFQDEASTECTLVFPLVFPLIKSSSMKEIIQQISESSQIYTIVLIQAGAAAIGLFEHDVLLHHKVIKKYMVRKKQGKSQLKHLNSKGKSRLGSRIRLRNSRLFFEEINEILTKWDVTSKSEVILLSVPINLKNLLFTSKIPVPFGKKDPRIRKVPVDVRTPSFKVLMHINWLATRGTLQRQQ